MSRTRDALIGVLLALTIAAALRGVWLTADPPTIGTVGIVWHDEGAWVHNARNKALWGAWRTDAWNPVFIAPVFTLLEYAAFRELGVGTWQARTVPVISGLIAIIALAAGLAAIGGTRTAVIGATFLATNYVFVMWNRAALMESTMTAFMAAAWGAYALAHARHPAWGLVSGMLAVLAWFSKAAAAFFIAAIVVDALVTVLLGHLVRLRNRFSIDAPSATDVRAALLTLAGLAATAGLIVAAFVLPHWGEYRFYNWQMSVTRKPSYALGALLDRASWLPLVQDSFTRMWMVLVAAAAAVMALMWRWRAARPAERLLVLWVVLGIAELVVHDAGNERRYVMFVPVLVALASLTITGSPAVTRDGPDTPRWMLIAPALLFAYLVVGSILRMAFLGDIRAGQLQLTVRLSAIASVPLALVAAARWNMVSEWLSRQRPSPMAIALLAAIVVGGDLVQYTQWARARTEYNYRASREIGTLLPEGTLVHGKLANGLSLENRIRPIFVGNGFGNYADRTTRDDVRYILTYVTPYLGYEGRVIRDVVRAYPARRIVATFPVAETAAEHDTAALIDKFGSQDVAARQRPPEWRPAPRRP